MKTTPYENHPIANIFPEMGEDELKALAADIKKNGLQDRIVLHEDKVLDGRHRQKACIMAGVEPGYIGFAALGEDVRKQGPLNYVISRNLHRRHLTTSQRSQIAVELIPAFQKAEEEARKSAEVTAPKGATSSDAKEAGKEDDKKSKSKGGKTTAKVAKAMGVSPRSVERAKKIAKESPEKAAKIKAGKSTVGKETRNISAEQKRKQALADAHKRLKQFGIDAKHELFKTPKDALVVAGQSDAELKRTTPLLNAGWSFKQAKAYQAKKVELKTKVEELLDRADAEGGEFHFDIDGYKIDIERK